MHLCNGKPLLKRADDHDFDTYQEQMLASLDADGRLTG